jgi:hypothetical protein
MQKNMKRSTVWLYRGLAVVLLYLFLCAIKSAIIPVALFSIGGCLLLWLVGMTVRGLQCMGDWLSYWRS